MTDQEPRPRMGAGNVKISLVNSNGDLEEFELKPSYLAARTLSSQSGGLVGALQRVGQFDVDTIAQVVALGLGYGTQTRRAPKDLPERIYQTGISDDTGGIAERCVTFIRVLMSGGRLPKESGEGDGDAGPDPTQG